jgi:hypothetical protein
MRNISLVVALVGLVGCAEDTEDYPNLVFTTPIDEILGDFPERIIEVTYDVMIDCGNPFQLPINETEAFQVVMNVGDPDRWIELDTFHLEYDWDACIFDVGATVTYLDREGGFPLPHDHELSQWYDLEPLRLPGFCEYTEFWVHIRQSRHDRLTDDYGRMGIGSYVSADGPLQVEGCHTTNPKL